MVQGRATQMVDRGPNRDFWMGDGQTLSASQKFIFSTQKFLSPNQALFAIFLAHQHLINCVIDCWSSCYSTILHHTSVSHICYPGENNVVESCPENSDQIFSCQ